ncbi:MAG TPA: 50S ribosomal protein L23 [Bacteroidia bacterium]
MANNIIVKPLVTEKITTQGEKYNRYGFEVSLDSNKVEIKKAVEQMYGVKVISVNTMNYMGKTKVRYTKTGFSHGRTNHFKKAIITVQEGDAIDLFNNI